MGSSRGCAILGVGLQPARRRPPALAPAYSRIAAWSCSRATRSCARRCSAWWTWPRLARGRARRAPPPLLLLGEVERPLAPGGRLAVPAARRASLRPATRGAVGGIAGVAVQRMAKRFIVGEGPQDAVPALAQLWRDGAAASVDLLGEATVTAAEADHYTARCDEALRTLAAAAAAGPAN